MAGLLAGSSGLRCASGGFCAEGDFWGEAEGNHRCLDRRRSLAGLHRVFSQRRLVASNLRIRRPIVKTGEIGGDRIIRF